MKIVLISPRGLTVPPRCYGGTERVIYYLAEALIRRGHKVVLFAKKGSKTRAKLYEYPSDDKGEMIDYIIRHMPADADLIHDHFGVVAKMNPPIPTIQQSHGDERVKRAQIPVYVSQTILRSTGKNKGYYIHNGIGMEDYDYKEKKEDYLLFLGRICPDKGVHLAVEVAQRTGRKLIIAGLLGEDNKAYYSTQIEPHLSSQITYVGDVGGKTKRTLLSNAYCVLFPSIWNEPFGLVPIEAMASGTPVVGLRYGAVPEVLRGFPQLVCEHTDDMVRMIRTGEGLPTALECRRYVEKYYTDQVMADSAIALYRRIIKGNMYRQFGKDSRWNKRKRKIGANK